MTERTWFRSFPSRWLGCISGWRLVRRACVQISQKLLYNYYIYCRKWPGKIDWWRHWWRFVTRWRHSSDVNGWGSARTRPRPGIDRRDRSSVNFEGKTFLPENYVRKFKINARILHHNCPKIFFNDFWVGWGQIPPSPSPTPIWFRWLPSAKQLAIVMSAAAAVSGWWNEASSCEAGLSSCQLASLTGSQPECRRSLHLHSSLLSLAQSRTLTTLPLTTHIACLRLYDLAKIRLILIYLVYPIQQQPGAGQHFWR